MKLHPFQRWINELVLGLDFKDEERQKRAYIRLKHRTGEDYGYDVDKWIEWGKQHPEISGMKPRN